jgi:hypothetical protein
MIIIQRRSGFTDKLRAYKVELDGSVIGEIRDGESRQFPVSQGSHTLLLKLDWCTSETVAFELSDKPVGFECGGKSPFLSGFNAIFKRNRYIRLERCDGGCSASVSCVGSVKSMSLT